MTAVALHDPNTQPQQRMPAQMQAMTPVDMLSIAVSNGASIEILERLITLQERWRAGEARRAFDAAIAAAKADIRPVPKTRSVGFSSGKGSTNYDYEGLDDIANMVDPALAKNGLSYRHRALQEGNHLTITCVLTHKDGHFEETTLGANNDQSGNKNAIQAVGSVATYLQRYTVKLALGLATTRDNDGQGAGERRARNQPATKGQSDTIDAEFASAEPEQQFAEPEMITAEQIAQLRAIADGAGVDHAKLCKFYGIADYAEIPATAFDKVVKALEAKRRKATQTTTSDFGGADSHASSAAAEAPAQGTGAGEPASSVQGGDAGTPSQEQRADLSPVEEARQAGREACEAGIDFKDIPAKYTKYTSYRKAWEQGYQDFAAEAGA